MQEGLDTRVASLEEQNAEIRTHFPTKADLHRMALTIVLAQTAVVSVAVAVILRFG